MLSRVSLHCSQPYTHEIQHLFFCRTSPVCRLIISPVHVEQVSTVLVLVSAAADQNYKARLCVLVTWPNFTGYGFNLHAERDKPAQYIGKVDAESPAEAAGLREGDRIVAVNGVDVADGTHQDVVRRIRSDPDKVELLVVDAAVDVYFTDCGVDVSASMDESTVQRIVCPPANIYTSLPSTAPVLPCDGALVVFYVC